jgi:Protein of unknown function (DUF3365)
MRSLTLSALVALATSLPAAEPAARSTHKFIDPSDPAVASVRKAGEAAIGAVGMKLTAALNQALGNGGPETAVEFCRVEAQPLTSQPLPAHPLVASVKRTTLRLRNPLNAPDTAEQAALTEMERRVALGETPLPVLVQKFTATTAGPTEWRIYRPIVVQAACLACHGSPSAQSPELRSLLQTHYPSDQATGYEVGEWRGLFRATVVTNP